MSTLRETLAAAMKDEQPEPVAAPVANDPTPPAAEAAAEPAPAEPAAAEPQDPEAPVDGAVARDEHGRFAKKDDPSEPAPAPAAEAPQPEEPIRVPASLPAPLKAKFKDLDPDWREAFLKREEDVNTAKAQWDSKAAQFNRLDEILAPRREQLALAGLSEADYLKTLFAADDWLKKDARSAIAYLARSYGVDLGQFVQQPGGHQQAQDPFAPQLQAALQPILQRVQTFEQNFQQQQTAAEQQRQAELNAEIAAFANDPAHLYFADVKDHIAALLETGAAETLKDAYEQAIWASPTIRPLLLEQQAKDAAAAAAKAQADAKAKADAEAAAKAAAAGKAAGSVTGAPGQAVAPPASSTGSIRGDLLAAMGQ